MKTWHLVITGRVQGVGYRDWLVEEATRLGLTGWVRNKGYDQVEAVVCGPDDAVELCVQHCWQGPVLAAVASINRTEAPSSGEASFTRRGSVPADR